MGQRFTSEKSPKLRKALGARTMLTSLFIGTAIQMIDCVEARGHEDSCGMDKRMPSHKALDRCVRERGAVATQ